MPDDAQAYVAWLSRQTDHTYRLPSEAEWEYAARAGTTGKYYWGDDGAEVCRFANSLDKSTECSDGYENTAPVGEYQPNTFGLYDVLGNASEWTEDCWNRGGYSGAPADGTPWVQSDCRGRVLRGGNWYATAVRSSTRSGAAKTTRLDQLGFRIARNVE